MNSNFMGQPLTFNQRPLVDLLGIVRVVLFACVSSFSKYLDN